MVMSSSMSSTASQQEVKTKIHQLLVESGEKDRLREHLRSRLIECGWRDELKLEAKKIIKERGLERVTLDDLVKEITPRGRSTVPDSVKRELLAKIKGFLSQQNF